MGSVMSNEERDREQLAVDKVEAFSDKDAEKRVAAQLAGDRRGHVAELCRVAQECRHAGAVDDEVVAVETAIQPARGSSPRRRFAPVSLHEQTLSSRQRSPLQPLFVSFKPFCRVGRRDGVASCAASAQCWSSMNCAKKSASASYASRGSTLATCWSGRTTIIAPLSRSMPRRSKISGPFLRSGV